MQARISELLRNRRKQHGIGRQGQVIDARDIGQSAHKAVEALIQKWFTTSQPQLADSKPCGNARYLENFLITQPLLFPQELVVSVKLILRHAIWATKIALVKDRDAQVVEGPVQGIARDRNNCRGHIIWNQV